MPGRGRGGRAALALGAAGAGMLLAGCSSAQEPDVEGVARAFEAPDTDPQRRCDLLAPATRRAVEKDAGAACVEAIRQIALPGGEVYSVQVWGGDAQVRLSGDTVFLARTPAGWRVTAAGCEARGEAPYDCEVEGP